METNTTKEELFDEISNDFYPDLNWISGNLDIGRGQLDEALEKAHTAGRNAERVEVKEALVKTLGAVSMGVTKGSTEEVLVDFIENYFDDTDIKNHLTE